MIKKTKRILNGYIVIYMPEHPKAMKSKNWDGWVYEHIVVAEKELNRPIRKDEDVHHLDLNKSNNSSGNLLVLTRSAHRKLHLWLIKIGYKGGDSVGANVYDNKSAVRCAICEFPLRLKQKEYCSTDCWIIGRENKSVMKDVLVHEVKQKLETRPMYSVCKDYGISDNGLKKWLERKIARVSPLPDKQ